MHSSLLSSKLLLQLISLIVILHFSFSLQNRGHLRAVTDGPDVEDEAMLREMII